MKRAFCSLVLLLAFGAAELAAQCSTPNGSASGTCSSNIASSLTIPLLIRMTISDTSTTLTAPTASDYDNGASGTLSPSAGPTVTIKTNNSWTLQVRATAANWTGTGGARATKPVGDLLWRTTSGTLGTPMTTTNTTVASGTRGSSNVTSIFYNTKWTWGTDTPGTYTLTVTFTATAP